MEQLRAALFPTPSHHGRRYNSHKGYSTRRKEPARGPSNIFSTPSLGKEEIMSSQASIEEVAIDSGVVAYLMASVIGGKYTMVRVFNGEEIRIGRQSLCQFQVPHLSCSNLHCRIYSVVFESCYEPLIYCEDLSMNGTFLNDRLIGKGISVLLTHGDRIEIRCAASFIFHQVPTTGAPVLNDPEIEKEKALFASSYKLSSRILGAGGYGRVYMAWDVKTHRQVACKIMELRNPNGGHQKNWGRMKEMYTREVDILKTLSHPNIMNIHKVVSTNSRFYIFEDLITGGDLFSQLGQKVCFDEIEVMPVVWQILKALEYIHKRGIVHRDLKPDNILCTSNAAGARIVLTDFGSARFIPPTTRMTSAVGTLEYLAPEILPVSKNVNPSGYSKSVDLWSLGVVIYVLLSGYSPFGAENGSTPPPDAVIAKARTCDLSRLDTGTEWGSISVEAKDFVRGLVCVDPRKRLTVEQAKKHRWLSRHTSELEEVYERAVEDWVKSERQYGEKNVTLEHFDMPQSSHSHSTGHISPPHDPKQNSCPYPMGTFSLEPSYPEEEMEDSSMLDVPDLFFSQFTPDSPQDCGEDCAWNMSGLYTVEEDELHDAAAGDGRLRSAMELAREVEMRRIERAEQGRVREDREVNGASRGERSRFFVGGR